MADPSDRSSAPRTERAAEPPEETHLPPGERVGRYELLGMLGAGGMSFVYVAHDPELDRKVALKLMRVRVGADRARRLQREAQALARLSHPNVVPVYDVGMVDGQAFVAMEYVEGKTLRTWLREKRLWRDVLDVMIDAGKGLAAAHAAGLIHRDFKPDNVLIGNDGRVRVLDFGLARLAGVLDGRVPLSNPSGDSGSGSGSGGPPSSSGARPSVAPTITRADELIGTPAYMAPEQVRGDLVDERTDVFAYGVTLYEALFGERPFDGPNAGKVGSEAATVTARIDDVGLRTPRPPPRGTHVPRRIQKIVLRALHHDPRERFASMSAMLEELGRDPYRVWRRVGVAAVGVAAASALAFGLARAQSRERAMCQGAAARSDAVWSAAAHDEVRAAFARTGLPYADDAAKSATRALDQWTARWSKAADDSCAATRIRGEQSEDVMDLRKACFDDRLRELAVLVDLFRRADPETVKSAARAAQSLTPVEQCDDVAALRAPTPKPKDKDAAAKVEDLEQRLAVVKATHDVGKETEAAQLADGLLDDAKKVGFVPLVARAELWRGRAYADLNESDKSIPSYRDAFASALASHEDRVLKESAARLAQEYIYASNDRDFEYWADVAQAAIDRGAPDPTLQSFLDHTRCVAMWSTGRIFDRLACLERHAAKVQRQRPLDEWELTTLGLAASDAGQLERGVEYVRRGYDYSLQMNGAAHPRTLEMRMFLCKALLDFGDVDAALAECREALATIEKVAPDNDYLLGKTFSFTAEAWILDKRWDDARDAIARGKKHAADPSDTEADTAQVDVATGHPERALPHLREALAETQKQLPPDHPNVIVSKIDLARALLAHGDVVEARAVADDALALASRADLSPLTRADVEFTDARALWRSDPASRQRALELATKARDAFEKSAPRTRRYDADRAEIEAWLARPQ